MTPATYAEQTRVEIYEPELEPDETLQPQAIALAQGIGSQLVPISFEVIGANSSHYTHNQYAYAAQVLFDTMDPDFISITAPVPDEYNPNDCLDIAAEHGDKSKILPVIDLTYPSFKENHLALLAEISTYRKWGVEKVLVRPPGAGVTGKFTANYTSLMRDGAQFSSVGVIVNAEKTSETQSISQDYNRTAQELAGADFGITQFLLSPKPYVELVKAMRERKVTAPILPGIKPFRHYSDVEATLRSSNVSLGEDFSSYMDEQALSKRSEALMTYFIAIGADLIKRHNAPGLHIYTDNNVRAAQRLATGVGQVVNSL